MKKPVPRCNAEGCTTRDAAPKNAPWTEMVADKALVCKRPKGHKGKHKTAHGREF